MDWKPAYGTIICALLLLNAARADAPVSQNSTRPATTQAAALRSEDRAVIEAALIHFLDDHDAQHSGRVDAKTIRLVDHTVEKVGMISPDQMTSELKDFALPEDAVLEMRVRNTGAVSLRELVFNDPRVVPTDARRMKDANSISDFWKTFPDAKGWAEIWLPGYSKDGRRAILRFWYGPAPHGAVGTYVLERGDAGQWTVVDRKLSYFL